MRSERVVAQGLKKINYEWKYGLFCNIVAKKGLTIMFLLNKTNGINFYSICYMTEKVFLDDEKNWMVMMKWSMIELTEKE